MISNDAKEKESEALFKLLRDRYVDRLTSNEWEEVRKGLRDMLGTSEALRSMKLRNGDEPFTVFKPYRRS